MEGLIRRRFTPHNSVGVKVYRKEYDVLSPTGEIILPETWDLLLKPGWVVEMRLWTTQGEGQMSIRSEYGTNQAPSMPASGSLKPPLSPQGGTSSVASSTSTSKRSSLKAWFSGRKLSRSDSYA